MFYKIISTKQKQHGLTLLELLTTLIVISLIVSGFFVKKTIEYQAKIKLEIKQLSKYRVAFNDFQIKYGGLPGDLVNAKDYWSSSESGNGDSTIRTKENRFSDEYTYGGEMSHVFEQLSLSYLLDEKYDSSHELGKGIPVSTLNDKMGISLYNGSTQFVSINVFYGNASALPSLEKADEPNSITGNTDGFLQMSEVKGLSKKLGPDLISYHCGVINQNEWCRYWYVLKN